MNGRNDIAVMRPLVRELVETGEPEAFITIAMAELRGAAVACRSLRTTAAGDDGQLLAVGAQLAFAKAGAAVLEGLTALEEQESLELLDLDRRPGGASVHAAIDRAVGGSE